MRGVPRERMAISAAPSWSMGTPMTSAERRTMMRSSSSVSNSRRRRIPKRERSGDDKSPGRVVAPTKVKGPYP